MAMREVWIGSLGPFLYDDESHYSSPDSPFFGKTRRGMASEQIRVLRQPNSPDEVVRNDDSRLEAVPGAVAFTQEGGFGIYMVNATTVELPKGAVVSTSNTVPEAVELGDNLSIPLGVVYEAIPVGEAGLVVVSGIADVLYLLELPSPGVLFRVSWNPGYATYGTEVGSSVGINIMSEPSGIGLARVMLRLGV